MPTLVLIGLVLLAMVVVGRLVARASRASPSAPPAVPPLSTQELEARLARLAESGQRPRPEPSAMCYSKAAEPPRTAEYVCPVDGSRSLYPSPSPQAALIDQITDLRQAAAQLPGLDATLDETAMCRQCTPDGRGEVALVIRHAGGTVARTEGVTGDDLQLLAEFLSGSLKHAGEYGNESPLKEQLPRIRQLLGLPEEK